EQGAADILDASGGRTAGKEMAAAMGLTWKTSYLVMGAYDVIVVLEAPDDETMARFALMGGMSGAVSTQTMRAFTESEADKIIRSMDRPPDQPEDE
ncbi:MAG: GYD domain-containing protein, partial [Actinomycetota bacterium]|nr:GYD domain-containing protein [Actinomycetota bacterium]